MKAITQVRRGFWVLGLVLAVVLISIVILVGRAPGNGVSRFAGRYDGDFEGDTPGRLTLAINKDGVLTGHVSVGVAGSDLQGKVKEDGSVQFVTTTLYAPTVDNAGKVSADGKITGTWAERYGPGKGTWNAAKKK